MENTRNFKGVVETSVTIDTSLDSNVLNTVSGFFWYSFIYLNKIFCVDIQSKAP